MKNLCRSFYRIRISNYNGHLVIIRKKKFFIYCFFNEKTIRHTFVIMLDKTLNIVSIFLFFSKHMEIIYTNGSVFSFQYKGCIVVFNKKMLLNFFLITMYGLSDFFWRFYLNYLLLFKFKFNHPSKFEFKRKLFFEQLEFYSLIKSEGKNRKNKKDLRKRE